MRVLREELPDAMLMFDNHSIRHSDDVEYSLRLCKAVAPYKPFWIEEPICPEHVEGYARIKGETGLTIAGGEHWYTRWAVKPFLDRKCVDFVQSDPTWCGGISEWLKICELVRRYPGVKVVPHITSPWTVAPHCVASQPEELVPCWNTTPKADGRRWRNTCNRCPMAGWRWPCRRNRESCRQPTHNEPAHYYVLLSDAVYDYPRGSAVGG